MNFEHFEKHIKSMFDEYRPESDNEQIWQNIEPHLKKKKKRRPFILFFGGLGLGILMLFLWWHHGQQGTLQAGGAAPVQSPNLLEPKPVAETEWTATSQTQASTPDTRLISHSAKQSPKGVTYLKNPIERLDYEQVVPKSTASVEPLFSEPKTEVTASWAAPEMQVAENHTTEPVVAEEVLTVSNILIEAAKPVVQIEEKEPGSLPTNVATKIGVNKEKKVTKAKKPSKSKTRPHKRKRNKQTLSLHTGLALPLKVLKANPLVEPNEDLLKNRKASEKSLEAFSGTINYTYATKKGLLFRAGLDYKRLNERFKVSYNVKETEIVTGVLTQTVNSSGQIIAQTMGSKEVTTTRIYSNIAYNYYQFLNMPIGMGYQRFNKRSQWELAGGLNFNLWFRAYGTTYNEFGNPRRLYYPNYLEVLERKAGLGLWASYGYSRNISRNIRWQLSVKADVPFKNITTDSYALIQRYYTLGLQGGLIFNLTQEKKSKHKKRR